MIKGYRRICLPQDITTGLSVDAIWFNPFFDSPFNDAAPLTSSSNYRIKYN